MKRLACVLALLAGPAFAGEAPAKSTVWLMVMQFRSSTISVTYPTREACEDSAKATGAHMKKLGLGRSDCMPVVQP